MSIAKNMEGLVVVAAVAVLCVSSAFSAPMRPAATSPEVRMKAPAGIPVVHVVGKRPVGAKGLALNA